MAQQETALPGINQLDAVDVFKLALQKSGKTALQVAGEMGWDSGQTKRIFSIDRYYPSFEHLPKLCSVLGNTLIVQWLQVQALNYGITAELHDVDCARLIKQIGRLFGEVSDVGKEAQKAIEDGVLEPKELRRIIRELNEVLDLGTDMLGELRRMERKLVDEGK